MEFTITRKMLSFVFLALLGALQHPVGANTGRWSIKEAINNTVDNLSNYAFKANTISYTSEADFSENGESVNTIELEPGQSLKYSCGKPGDDRKGAFTMVPNDPTQHVLEFKGENSMDIALKKLRPSYLVYRSDAEIIVKTFQSLGLDHLLITYHNNAIIAAREPENFSINLVCIFKPTSDSKNFLYRWLQIKFKNVTHLPYGCGTTMFHMFKNTIPFDLGNPRERVLPMKNCAIEASPGMIVGIYCSKDEKVYPNDCFTQPKWTGGPAPKDAILLEADFPHNHPTGNFRLARVTEESANYNVTAACYCLNRRNTVTSSVKIIFKQDQTCNLTSYLREYYSQRGKVYYQCHKELSNGRVVTLIIPKPSNGIPMANTVGVKGIFPENADVETLVVAQNPLGHKYIRIDELLAGRGVYTIKGDDGKNFIYEFSAARDAIIILKQAVSNLGYSFEYFHTFGPVAEVHRTILSIGIIPTDPYVHGCGAFAQDFFNQDDIKVEIKKVNTATDEYNEVSCTVNGYMTSPLGFYCPPGYILEPPNCFTDAIRASTGHVVAVKEYAPFARVVKSKNIKVLDFSINDEKLSELTYSNEVLQCLCKRPDGAIMATINLDLTNPRA